MKIKLNFKTKPLTGNEKEKVKREMIGAISGNDINIFIQRIVIYENCTSDVFGIVIDSQIDTLSESEIENKISLTFKNHEEKNIKFTKLLNYISELY